MKRLLLSALALAFVAFSVTGAADAHTRADAKAMVDKAIAFLKTNGREKALAAFNDPKGEFVQGDLYVYVMDAKDPNLTMLAHPIVKALVGKPQIGATDADGKAFNAGMVKMLATRNEGWVEYRWPNPVTHQIAQKISFVEKVDGLIIGCGIYE